jgi:hypothetical protein
MEGEEGDDDRVAAVDAQRVADRGKGLRTFDEVGREVALAIPYADALQSAEEERVADHVAATVDAQRPRFRLRRGARTGVEAEAAVVVVHEGRSRNRLVVVDVDPAHFIPSSPACPQMRLPQFRKNPRAKGSAE